MEFLQRSKIWSVLSEGRPEDHAAVVEIAKAMGLSDLTAQVLYNRGCQTPEDTKNFLQLSDSIIHDPFLLTDIEKAVARIRVAIEKHERIAIYGDYDVDGVTSVSALYLFLKSKGADVGYYIPSRMRDGYGVSKAAIDMLADQRGVELIVTVDTGITAIEEVKYARERGIDMVITDHHECHTELPAACAVVNPHRPDCNYPFKELAGVGVVFKLLCAYEMALCFEKEKNALEGAKRVCEDYADLVALGTIADVMPIIDENRIIVSYGLYMIAHTKRPGLSALIDESLPSTKMRGGVLCTLSEDERAEQRIKRVNSGFVGFGLAPRMNAAGRISSASKAVELLLSETEETATALAKELCEINIRRQVEENRVAEQAYRMIEESVDLAHDRVIVLEDDTWPQGIVGIVASRITEKYGLPSILFSFDGATRGYPCADDMGKGSGRSVKGMNLVEALMHCNDHLLRFGGHELAAGMSIRRGDIDSFRQKINEYARTCLDDESLALHLDADCEVEIEELTLEVAEELTRLEPFGVSNPVPQFILRDMNILRIIPMGSGKHTKLLLSKNDISIYAVYFGVAPAQLHFAPNQRVDVLFQLNINEFQNERTLQLFIQDIRSSEKEEKQHKALCKRYEEIRSGAAFAEEENVIPDRDDFALVYTFLRREFRQGNVVFTDRAILASLDSISSNQINYLKLKFILRVFQELQICGVTEPEEGYYIFDMYFTPTKTSIDKSSILKKLRGQCRKD